MSFHGQTFTRAPMTKPTSTSIVCLSQRASSQWRNLENARMPMTQPIPNTARTGMSRLLTACIT